MKILKKLIPLVFLFFFVTLGYVAIWVYKICGEIGVEQILFHLFMPMKNPPIHWMKDFYIPVLLSIGTCLYIWYFSTVMNFIIRFLNKLSSFFKNKKVMLVILALVVFFIFDVWFINQNFHVWEFYKDQKQSSDFIQKNYVDPHKVKLTFPKKKKNLIHIMVESMETSYQDKRNGGLFQKNYIPELTKIAKENISFSYSDKLAGLVSLPGTEWTIGGMVAQTAGIPLKLYKGTRSVNIMDKYRYFLPGVKTLGDILYENGYTNYFVLGTNKEFAGKADYYTQHGKYNILDQDVIEKEFFLKRKLTDSMIRENNPQETPYWSGRISDSALFMYLQEKLPALVVNTPFSILILTSDTHFGNKEHFSSVSKDVSKFLKWLQKQPFYKDTVIVISGDHFNLNQEDFREITELKGRYYGNIKRKVYNAIINTPVLPIRMKKRKISVVDMFPTILASLGVTIDGEKLGLGTNLFSDKKTLLEKYEIHYIFSEMRKKSNWYNRHLLYGKQ